MTTDTQHLETLAHLASNLRVPYATLLKAIELLGLEPTLTVNGIAHYDAAACELLAAHVGINGKNG